MPTGAEVESAFPVGQEWRQRVSWGSPRDYYKAGFELYQDAIAVCMEASGFSYTRAPWYDDDIVAVVTNPLNKAAAAEYGYHLPPYGAGSSPQADPQGDDREGSSASYRTQLGTCNETADEYAYGGVAAEQARGFDAILASMGNSLRPWEATELARQLLTSWSECMASKGYRYKTPLDANTEFSEASEVGAKELEVRAADLECDEQVHLTESRSKFEVQEFDSWAEDNALLIREQEDLLVRATKQVQDRRAALDRNGNDAISV